MFTRHSEIAWCYCQLLTFRYFQFQQVTWLFHYLKKGQWQCGSARKWSLLCYFTGCSFFPLLGSSNQIPQNKRWREIWIKGGSSPNFHLHRKQHCSIPGQHGKFQDEIMPFPLHVYLGKTLNAINHTISTAHLEGNSQNCHRLGEKPTSATDPRTKFSQLTIM